MSGTKVKGAIRSSHSISSKYGFASAPGDLEGALKNLKRKGIKGLVSVNQCDLFNCYVKALIKSK